VKRLTLAADQFIVRRATPGGEPRGTTVIAGYPWFSDWGRDTMIALPGLTLATGRHEVAEAILTTFSRHVDQGMLPNYFPDDGQPPEYNTVDAALWLFQAVRAYYEATGNDALLGVVFPVLEEIVASYERGTRWNIQVDPDDGLVRQGAPGVQLTWMDARVDDWVVTPREGKPVEVNALWYSALVTMTGFARKLKRPAEGYVARAQRAERGFKRFWNDERGCLFDVLDGPDGNDAKIRPNQIFAVSLPDSPLNAAQRRAVVDTCGRLLVTSHGMRSLAPGEPGYVGTFRGDRRERDGAYHQGTAWTWLLPHFALAHERVYGDRATALGFLEPFGRLIGEMGLGSLPEIADGDPPHTPRGCFAQAWSVAEALRVYTSLTIERRRTRRRNAPRTAMALAR
jgi:predicted glycogen debranching enzyme